jgi:hypothetical protein
MFNSADEALVSAFREIVQQEIEQALGAPGFAQRADADRGPTHSTHESLPGVDPFSLVPFAEHVLGEVGGGPLHTSVMAPRIYELGFQHRWPPKYKDQLERSLNSLASPSQHPDKFERVAPRTLRLKS